MLEPKSNYNIRTCKNCPNQQWCYYLKVSEEWRPKFCYLLRKGEIDYSDNTNIYGAHIELPELLKDWDRRLTKYLTEHSN